MSTFAMTALIKVTFMGRNGGGSISVSGVKAGDYMLNVDVTANTGNGGNSQNGFQVYIDADDTVQQISGSNLSATEFTAFLIRM